MTEEDAYDDDWDGTLTDGMCKHAQARAIRDLKEMWDQVRRLDKEARAETRRIFGSLYVSEDDMDRRIKELEG